MVADDIDLTQNQERVLHFLPADKHDIAAELECAENTAKYYIEKLRDKGVDIVWNPDTGTYTHATDNEDTESDPLPTFDTTNTDTIPTTDDLPDGLLRTLRQDGLTYDDFNTEYGWSRDQVSRLLQRLREAGYELEYETIDDNGTRLWYIPDDGDKRYRLGNGDGRYRFGLISDTHLGAKTERLDDLHDFYDRLVDHGIDLVFHAGDIGDGWKVHRNHVNGVKGKATGWERLRDYVIDNYPHRDDIDTLFIEGNHDHKLYRREGIHFGELIDQRRDDLHYLGDSQARIVFDDTNDIDLELIHPAGGKPYTLGYRLQTLYRERPLHDRPTIAAIGHLHGQMQAESEGVLGFYTGCWKDLTTYGQRRGHKGAIGGWIIDLEIQSGEVRSLGTRWVTYGDGETTQHYSMHDISDMIDATPQTF